MMALSAARVKTHPHGRRATKGSDPFISLRVRGQMKSEGRDEVSVRLEFEEDEAAVEEERWFGFGVRLRVVVSWSKDRAEVSESL